MFDARLRPLIDPPLNRIGALLAAAGVSANAVTLTGMAIGVLAGVSIGFEWIVLGLALILVNRLFDGIDGAVARVRGPGALGGYLDIVADFVFYVAIPLGFAFAAAPNMPFALVLIASFTLTGISFLAFAVVAAERGLKTEAHGRKSFFYSTGIAEGTETIVVFVLMCVVPSRFPYIASAYAALCGLTVIQRTMWAARVLAVPPTQNERYAMRIFPSIPDEPDMASVFRRFPHTLPPLLDYHDRVLRDPSPLTVAERELIAAYVSGLNACTYCHGAHRVAAAAFGIDDALFDSLLDDLETSPIDNRLKPILAYVRKLTLTPARLVEADAATVYEMGWDEQALFDAISVAALFNLMNRIVEGTGIRSNPLDETADERTARRTRMAAAGGDAHSAPHSYSRLLDLWEIPALSPHVHDHSE